jgi:S1-C subfamily serine protease
VIVTVVVLGGLATGIYLRSAHDRAARDAEIQTLLAANAQMTKDFQTRLQGDTILTKSLQRHNDSLTRAVREAKSAQQSVAAQAELKHSQDLQRKFSEWAPAVRDANDAAIALISTVLGGQTFESTGFSVNASGLLVTNRHVVLDSSGNATRIRVKFANTRNWLRARVVKVDDDPTIDLALLQVEGAPGPLPRVRQVASAVDAPVGGSIATIGYPLGTDTPMDGGAAKTTLTMGTISKLVRDILQIDSFASHGSSGSPVFDQHGHVIGVVYGGPADAAGRIAYAVPAGRIAELLKSLR